MLTEELMKSLSVRNGSKILLLMVAGLGGLPESGKTELEGAGRLTSRSSATILSGTRSAAESWRRLGWGWR